MDATVRHPHPQDRRARRDRLQKCFIGWHRIRTGIGMALPRESIYLSVDALPEPLEPTRVRKVPTGIADLDSIVDGGFPSGSTILLLGDVGAGMQEYVYTASAKTSLVNERPQARHYYLGDHCDHSELPNQVCYVTFSRSKEIILQELATSFNGDYYRAFRDHTVFKDFSSVYFRHSVVPATWTNEDDVFDRPSTNILEELVAFLDENAHDSMVVIDSITDLAVSDIVEIKDLVTTQGSPASREAMERPRIPDAHAGNPRTAARFALDGQHRRVPRFRMADIDSIEHPPAIHVPGEVHRGATPPTAGQDRPLPHDGVVQSRSRCRVHGTDLLR